MLDAVGQILQDDPRIAYGLVHGSVARGSSHPGSDLDVAIGLSSPMSTRDLGNLIGRLEGATGRPVDLVLLDSAPPALAYRVFRDGVIVCEKDHDALCRRRARAFLEYFDFEPIERLCARGVLTAATHGR